MLDLKQDVGNRPWMAISDADLGPALSVPSMLNLEERQLYHWLGQYAAQGPGAIVDLGCFAGGSTACLAQGNRAAGGSNPIFAYDKFTASEKVKARQLIGKGVAPFEGGNIRPVVRRLLSPWAPRITLKPGRIEKLGWTGEPIRVLILDASKTAELTDQIAEIFFPSLIAGESVVVQQDQLHWKEPWNPVQMVRLTGYLEPLCMVPNTSVTHLCTQAIDADALAAARVSELGDRGLMDGLQQAAQDAPFPGMQERIACQMDAVRLNPGIRASWRFKVQPSK